MKYERERLGVLAAGAAFAALAALAAIGSWLIGHESVSPPPPLPSTTDEPTSARADSPSIDPAAVAGVERTAARLDASSVEPPHATETATVHVRGQVTRSGVAVAGTELSFYAARDAWRERAVDWAITDSAGHYEVELPADCYLVDFQDTGIFAATVFVPSGTTATTWDFVLPSR